MSWQSVIDLQPSFFGEAEKKLVSFDELSVTTFRFSTGVLGLRLANRLGQVVMLPYQGQQIWDAAFYGRTLTMKSMFKEPNPTSEYLRTYGAFLLHCGALTMGVPGPKDTHPLHGELPNAPYQVAQVVLGEDERGIYAGLTGTYQYTVAFNHNYLAQPLVKLYAGQATLPISMTVKNLKRTPMDLMYLAHVNFRPVNQAELVYSAVCSPETVRVRSVIPSHIHPPAGYAEFLNQLAAQPQMHHVLKPDLAYDPEAVLFIDYLADEKGWGHCLQVLPDGSADWISHRIQELGCGVRWISRTPDQDALGMNLPATAQPDGQTLAREKGSIKTIAGGGAWQCQMEAGALNPAQTRQMVDKVKAIAAKG